jgi:PPOX class probable F420-dependent enzyme
VPTPVWAAPAGEVLYARSERCSGKVKRLRRDPRMLVAPCTVRGEPLGAPFEASGRVLSPEEEPLAERTLAERYALGRELFERTMDLLRVDMCYLELTPKAWG